MFGSHREWSSTSVICSTGPRANLNCLKQAVIGSGCSKARMVALCSMQVAVPADLAASAGAGPPKCRTCGIEMSKAPRKCERSSHAVHSVDGGRRDLSCCKLDSCICVRLSVQRDMPFHGLPARPRLQVRSGGARAERPQLAAGLRVVHPVAGVRVCSAPSRPGNSTLSGCCDPAWGDGAEQVRTAPPGPIPLKWIKPVSPF